LHNPARHSGLISLSSGLSGYFQETNDICIKHQRFFKKTRNQWKYSWISENPAPGWGLSGFTAAFFAWHNCFIPFCPMLIKPKTSATLHS